MKILLLIAVSFHKISKTEINLAIGKRKQGNKERDGPGWATATGDLEGGGDAATSVVLAAAAPCFCSWPS